MIAGHDLVDEILQTYLSLWLGMGFCQIRLVCTPWFDLRAADTQGTSPCTRAVVCQSGASLTQCDLPSMQHNFRCAARYTSDDDRVALNVMDFASPNSTGANPCVFSMVQQRQQPGQGEPSQPAAPAPDSTASSSSHLAMMSGVYGSFTSMDGSSLASMDGPGAGAPQVCLPLPPFAVRAGPRDQVYYDAKTVTAAIVTTGEDTAAGSEPARHAGSHVGGAAQAVCDCAGVAAVAACCCGTASHQSRQSNKAQLTTIASSHAAVLTIMGFSSRLHPLAEVQCTTPEPVVKVAIALICTPDIPDMLQPSPLVGSHVCVHSITPCWACWADQEATPLLGC